MSLVCCLSFSCESEQLLPAGPTPTSTILSSAACHAAGILPGSGYEPSDRWYGQQAVFRLSMGNWVRMLFSNLSMLCLC